MLSAANITTFRRVPGPVPLACGSAGGYPGRRPLPGPPVVVDVVNGPQLLQLGAVLRAGACSVLGRDRLPRSWLVGGSGGRSAGYRLVGALSAGLFRPVVAGRNGSRESRAGLSAGRGCLVRPRDGLCCRRVARCLAPGTVCRGGVVWLVGRAEGQRRWIVGGGPARLRVVGGARVARVLPGWGMSGGAGWAWWPGSSVRGWPSGVWSCRCARCGCGMSGGKRGAGVARRRAGCGSGGGSAVTPGRGLSVRRGEGRDSRRVAPGGVQDRRMGCQVAGRRMGTGQGLVRRGRAVREGKGCRVGARAGRTVVSSQVARMYPTGSSGW